MTVLIAIPARYASTRYPGKPLVALKGPDGEKTLIRRSWEAAMAVRGADRVVVATGAPPELARELGLDRKTVRSWAGDAS